MCVPHVVEKMPLSSAPAGACATATDIVKSAIGESTSPHAQEGPTNGRGRRKFCDVACDIGREMTASEAHELLFGVAKPMMPMNHRKARAKPKTTSVVQGVVQDQDQDYIKMTACSITVVSDKQHTHQSSLALALAATTSMTTPRKRHKKWQVEHDTAWDKELAMVLVQVERDKTDADAFEEWKLKVQNSWDQKRWL